jgi:hypothetical protein
VVIGTARLSGNPIALLTPRHHHRKLAWAFWLALLLSYI